MAVMVHYPSSDKPALLAPGLRWRPPLPEHRHGLVEYPEADGVPLGETETHIRAIFHLFGALDHHFRADSQTYVGADMLLYFEEGDSTQVVVPDVFVVRGIEKRRRRIYKLWEEEVMPQVVIEVTSKSSRLEDIGAKKALYQILGVSELYLFDPLEEYLVPRFCGFHLVGGEYQERPFSEERGIESPVLGMALTPRGDLLRLRDPFSGQLVPTLEEEFSRAEEESRRAGEESRRAEEESRRAEALEAELVLLKAENEKLRRSR